MNKQFICLLALIFFSAKGFCQGKVSAPEYKVYNAVLNEIFVQRKFETQHVPKQHTVLNITPITVNRVLDVPQADYAEMLTDTFYKNFENLNKATYQINPKKITVKVNSKFKQFDIDFSRCYIDKEYAVLYIGIQFAPLNGEGAVYVLKQNKTTKTWTIVKKTRKWVS